MHFRDTEGVCPVAACRAKCRRTAEQHLTLTDCRAPLCCLEAAASQARAVQGLTLQEVMATQSMATMTLAPANGISMHLVPHCGALAEAGVGDSAPQLGVSLAQ